MPDIQPPNRHLARRILAGLCVFLTCVLFLVSVFSLFIERELLDSDAYSAKMKEVIEQPVVQKAVSVYATDELFTALKIQKRVTDFLPEKLKFVGAPATSAVQGFAAGQVERLLGQDQFQDIWVTVNKSTHETVVSVLRGEPGHVTLSEDGSVYVDILPIVKDLALQFTEGTAIHKYVAKIPDNLESSALRVNLSKALKVTLPEDFGVVKVVKSEQLIKARRIVLAIDTASIWAPWAALGFFFGAVAVSANRRKTFMHLGEWIAATAMIGLGALQLAINYGLSGIADDSLKQLYTVVVNVLTYGLPEIFYAAAIAGIFLWIIAFLAGQKEWFIAMADGIRALFGRVSAEDLAKNPAILWIKDHTEGLCITGFFAGTFVLLWWGNRLAVAIVGAVLIAGEAKLLFLTGWTPFKKTKKSSKTIRSKKPKKK
jgi:hypothetical protein